MKKQTTGAYFLKLTLTLFLITAVVAGLLGLVNYITADTIEGLAADKAAAAKHKVLPADSYDEVMDYADSTGLVNGLWSADDKGYVAQCTVGGSQGDITLMVGIRSDGTVAGVSIISFSETAGLGANAAKPEFTAQFDGKSGEVKVTKDGGEIDALTGATVTSRAVCAAVSAAAACVAGLN